MRKGLSSSAAVCVLVVQAMNLVYGLHLDTTSIMELAYRGEMLTPSRCGRMDQCVAMGSNSIAIMEFEGEICRLKKLECNRDIYIVVVDLNASKDTRVILRDLNACYPFPKNDIQVNDIHCLSVCLSLRYNSVHYHYIAFIDPE